jgi:hypothetical protein
MVANISPTHVFTPLRRLDVGDASTPRPGIQPNSFSPRSNAADHSCLSGLFRCRR